MSSKYRVPKIKILCSVPSRCPRIIASGKQGLRLDCRATCNGSYVCDTRSNDTAVPNSKRHFIQASGGHCGIIYMHFQRRHWMKMSVQLRAPVDLGHCMRPVRPLWSTSLWPAVTDPSWIPQRLSLATNLLPLSHSFSNKEARKRTHYYGLFVPPQILVAGFQSMSSCYYTAAMLLGYE